MAKFKKNDVLRFIKAHRRERRDVKYTVIGVKYGAYRLKVNDGRILDDVGAFIAERLLEKIGEKVDNKMGW